MRLVVVGTSGAGKSTFASALAASRGLPCVELDALFWAENWTPRSADDFTANVQSATAGDAWVVDGDYSDVRSVLWPRATDIVWLNFGPSTVFPRIVWRTLRRVLTRERLWAGNRESFVKAFLSKDSIVLWSFSTFPKNQRKYAHIRASGQYPQLQWHELLCPAQARQFLRGEQT